MRIGLALPHYDCSIAGENPLGFDTLLQHAQAAEHAGYDSLWISDHLTWDLAKYGGGPQRYGVFEAMTTLAALARTTQRVRIGSLVLCAALRSPGVLAKAIAATDQFSNGRLDIGLGAGWYEPDYAALGTPMPRAGERLEQLDEYLQILRGLLHSQDPVTLQGAHYCVAGATNDPGPRQDKLPLFVGGKGDRLLRMIARHGVGWNTCWAWTPDAYRERLGMLERSCEAVERDPATIWRTLGLYALCGESERDLQRRFDRMVTMTPDGVLDGMSLAQWRTGRLVGTVQQIGEQAEEWESLGVETVICGVGAVPFQTTTFDDIEMIRSAFRPEK